MTKPSSYIGTWPFWLYIELQNRFPQFLHETDAAWLRRTQSNPSAADFIADRLRNKGSEFAQKYQQRLMALAGGRRTGSKYENGPAGPGLVKVPGTLAKRQIAERFQKELMENNSNQYRHRNAAYSELLTLFDESIRSAKPGGTIFWNGVNELALAKLVDQWNTELAGEIYGQLEATTSARYVNKQFAWEDGPFKNYFTEVSERLGAAAKGHVTAVVRCGFRNDSIFTTTELPRMFSLMEASIKANALPLITDLSVVVIEPKHQPDKSVAIFTNSDIEQIPIIRLADGTTHINGRNDCVEDSLLPISDIVREYWKGRTSIGASSAASKIKDDCDQLIRWP